MAAAAAEAADPWSITVAVPRVTLDWGWSTPIVLSYLVIAVITFGVHNRSAREKAPVTFVKSAFWGAAWPIYWLGPIGPLGILRRLTDFVVDVVALISRGVVSVRGELLFVYYSIAFVFIPAYQVYLHWDGGDGLWSYLGILVKALLWGLAWPLYIVVRVFNL